MKLKSATEHVYARTCVTVWIADCFVSDYFEFTHIFHIFPIKISHKGIKSLAHGGSFKISWRKWSEIVHKRWISLYYSFFSDTFICNPSRISLRYFLSTIPNRHYLMRIYWSSLIWAIILIFSLEFYENIFTILKPSISAVCCLILGITPFNCSMISYSMDFIWDFDS